MAPAIEYQPHWNSVVEYILESSTEEKTPEANIKMSATNDMITACCDIIKQLKQAKRDATQDLNTWHV